MKKHSKVHQDGRHMSESQLKNHHNPKAGKQEPGVPKSGGNLTFPKTSQAIHVCAAKDKLAGNVGGSSAHMAPDAKSLGHQDLIESSGEGIKKKREKY